MSYLKDVQDSLKNIDELCYGALKEDDDYVFYIKEIHSRVDDAISNFESLILELKIGEDRLKEALEIFEDYIHGRD
ncbi:hypothetical protein [Neisseria elongata]|nr:MAG TPA: hypothetical protein [Caudoviricetes sp.]